MKNILIPTDFSIASQNATKYAVSLARFFDVNIHIVNTITPLAITDDSILAPIMITQAEVIEQNTKLMEQEIETLSKIHPARFTTILREGLAAEIIPELAQETDSDLIIMGMKGKGESNSIFGSTTTTVIRKSTYPVFVIPKDAAFKPIDNILLASDLDSEIEMERYALLLTLADKFNSHINILHVEKMQSNMNKKKAIDKIETSTVFSKHDYQFHTINENRVETGNNNFIEKNHSDVLAMVANQHPLFDRLFGRVHTKIMSYQTKIPLLVLQGK